MKFRKKPAEIEAMQLVGTEVEMFAVYQWIEKHIGSVHPPMDDEVRGGKKLGVTLDPAEGGIVIRTMECDWKVNHGDWVIRGVNGDFYPCNPSIFEKTYEPVGQ